MSAPVIRYLSQFAMPANVAVAIVLGVAAARKDVQEGRVPNAWIGISIAVGVSLYFMLALAVPEAMPPRRLAEVGVNFAISLVVGFLMWRANLWAAGDAKLFAGLSLLIPLDFYQKWYFPYFPSLSFLINTFLPAGAVLLLRSVHHAVGGGWRRDPDAASFDARSLFRRASIRRWAWEGIGWLSMLVLTSYVRSLVMTFIGPMSTLVTMVLLMGLYGLRGKLHVVFRNGLGSVLLMLSSGALIGMDWHASGTDGLKRLALFAAWGAVILLLFRLIRFLTDMYLESQGTQRVKIKYLKPGLVLSRAVMDDLERKAGLSDCQGRLGADDIRRIQDHLSPDETLGVQSSFPFAPFVLAGLILTLLTRNSLSHLVMIWFRTDSG